MRRARANALELKPAFISDYSCQASLPSDSRHQLPGCLSTPTANSPLRERRSHLSPLLPLSPFPYD